MSADAKMTAALLFGFLVAACGSAAEDRGHGVIANMALGVTVLALLAAVWWLVKSIREVSS